MEKFSVADIGEDDLDFEPDIDDTAVAAKKDSGPPSWMDNVSSPKKVKEDDDEDDDLQVSVGRKSQIRLNTINIFSFGKMFEYE